MHYLTEHWVFGPYVVIAIAAALWHEIGLHRLTRSDLPADPADPGWSRRLRRRSLLFYAGLAVLVIGTESPVDYWGYDYFFVHMIQHLLLMFAVPSLLVAAAPWRALFGDRALTSGPAVRAVARVALQPWVGVAAFSVVMVFWHLPGPFDLADQNRAVHIWLMEPTFVLAGIMFWLQFISSPPARIRMSAIGQAAALLATNCVMWVLAMAMGFLTSTSWYSVYNHIPGVTLRPSPISRSGRHPVDLRRLLGCPDHGVRDPQADGRGRQRVQRGRPHPRTWLVSLQLGQPGLTRHEPAGCERAGCERAGHCRRRPAAS